MSRKSKRPQSPRHIPIYDQDWAFLQYVFGPTGLQPEIGIGPYIRELVHLRVERLRADQLNAIDQEETAK